MGYHAILLAAIFAAYIHCACGTVTCSVALSGRACKDFQVDNIHYYTTVNPGGTCPDDPGTSITPLAYATYNAEQIFKGCDSTVGSAATENGGFSACLLSGDRKLHIYVPNSNPVGRRWVGCGI